jgi:hypothetical protein
MNKIGIIAEDKCDIEVAKHLIRKISPNKLFKVKKFLGKGHGKISGKGAQWAKNLKDVGCTILIVLHDLDTKQLQTLQQSLARVFLPYSIKKSLIVIPVREIEAWLLADTQAIQSAFNLQKAIPAVADPESILDPKRKLTDLVRISSKHTVWYVNTIHNERIALHVNLGKIRRCQSFLPLEAFLLANMK